MTAARPRLLDLFCGAGGCAKGYQRAGFYVVGVDINPQPNYCGDEFVQQDAMEWLRDLALSSFELGFWDAIHASPPCQAYTTMNNRHGSSSPELIDEIRSLIPGDEMPYVIENVMGAKQHLIFPTTLTGEMFGLGVYRPRLFETNWPLMAPKPPARQKDPAAVYGKMDGRRLWTRSDGTVLYASKDLKTAQQAMGIDWMEWDELREAVPPAYTELIGHQLMQRIAQPSFACADPEQAWIDDLESA